MLNREDFFSAITPALHEVANESEAVSKLDPFGLDEIFIGGLDAGSPLVEKLSVVREKISRRKNLTSVRDALAGLRDLGMVAAAMRRNDISLNSVQNLEGSLFDLASICNEVPRDTVFSYGPRNPNNNRKRRFTSHPLEDLFVNSFSHGMRTLDMMVSLLAHALLKGTSSQSEIIEIEQALDKFTNTMVTVRREIPPAVFTFEIRPYFDPVTIMGVNFLAPGGAQMPLLLLDFILWGHANFDGWYLEYLNENSKYLPRQIKSLIQAGMLCRSDIAEYYRRYAFDNRTALRVLIKKLAVFRRVHLQVANANFRLRDTSAVGSGGYSPQILNKILSQTEILAAKLSAL